MGLKTPACQRASVLNSPRSGGRLRDHLALRSAQCSPVLPFSATHFRTRPALASSPSSPSVCSPIRAGVRPYTYSPARVPQGEVAYGHISILRDSFHFLKISPRVSTSSYSPPPNSFSGAFAGSVSCDTFPLVRVTPPDLLRRGGGREGATARPRGLGVRLRCGRPRGGGGASFEVRGSLEAGPSHVCLPPVTRLLSIPRETAEQALQRDRSHETTEKKRAATGERERRRKRAAGSYSPRGTPYGTRRTQRGRCGLRRRYLRGSPEKARETGAGSSATAREKPWTLASRFPPNKTT